MKIRTAVRISRCFQGAAVFCGAIMVVGTIEAFQEGQMVLAFIDLLLIGLNYYIFSSQQNSIERLKRLQQEFNIQEI